MASSDRPEASRDRWGEMMSAVQAGDALIYEKLLGELVVWLRGYYRRRLPPGTVDDVVQDVLLAVHEKRATYDPNRPFGPWLAAIARYKWIDRNYIEGFRGTIARRSPGPIGPGSQWWPADGRFG